jgi:hypothetical protein
MKTQTISINELRQITATPETRRLAQQAANGSAAAVAELKKKI